MKTLTLALLLALAAIWPGSAQAHPHAWIDLRTMPVFDDRGQVVGLKSEWLFDEMFSVVTREDMVASGENESDFLRALAILHLTNLKEFDYFTEIKVGELKLPMATVKEFDSEFRGNRLWMEFTIPLVLPVDPRKEALSWSAFDPTYYIEMLHLEDRPVGFAGSDSGSAGCSASVIAPEPSEEMTLYAAALDQTETPTVDSLGAMFAEWVTLSCES